MKPSLFRRIADLLTLVWHQFDTRAGDNSASKVGSLLALKHSALSLCLVFCSCQYMHAYAADASAVTMTGSDVFLKYCAGCHGFDGFAEYEHAPSFSMGERLHKSDDELLQSILAGKHAMPYWQNKLSHDMFHRAIDYLRVMAQRYSSGLPPRDEPIPETHYKFNPVGEDEDYWLNED